MSVATPFLKENLYFEVKFRNTFGLGLSYLVGDVYSLYEDVISRYLAMMNTLLNGPRHRFSEASANVPKEPGVYAIYDEKQKATIYAGRTKNLRRRLLGDHKRGNIKGSQFRRALQQNRNLNSESQISRYILENCSFQFMAIKRFEEMVRLEHFTAAVLAPLLNTQLKQ